MAKSILLVLFLFSFSFAMAQQRRMPRPQQGRPLLKELQLTPRQRMQIQQLIRQERVQQLLYNQRLQQILTPAQKEKLLRFNKQRGLLDSLNNEKRVP
ncbi:MAG TPA: hypothetical protein VGM41_02260 [Chitinophagaceae bacterium]|jgi:hypothetical protein